MQGAGEVRTLQKRRTAVVDQLFFLTAQKIDEWGGAAPWVLDNQEPLINEHKIKAGC